MTRPKLRLTAATLVVLAAFALPVAFLSHPEGANGSDSRESVFTSFSADSSAGGAIDTSLAVPVWGASRVLIFYGCRDSNGVAFVDSLAASLSAGVHFSNDALVLNANGTPAASMTWTTPNDTSIAVQPTLGVILAGNSIARNQSVATNVAKAYMTMCWLAPLNGNTSATVSSESPAAGIPWKYMRAMMVVATRKRTPASTENSAMYRPFIRVIVQYGPSGYGWPKGMTSTGHYPW
jgi:hypothetical protein